MYVKRCWITYLTLFTLAKGMVGIENFSFLNKYTFKNAELGKNTKEQKFAANKESWFWKAPLEEWVGGENS